MSFWSDASGSTKGILVVGALLIIVGVIYLLMPEGERVQERGFHPEGGAATSNE
jgi:hypothetical protein